MEKKKKNLYFRQQGTALTSYAINYEMLVETIPNAKKSKKKKKMKMISGDDHHIKVKERNYRVIGTK